MPQITVNNVNFHYEISGQGKTELVFIPGYTNDINLWRSIAEPLSSQNKILLFDPQGSGHTEDNGAPLSIEEMAKNIHQLYLALGFKKPVIIGFALGAGVVLSIAHQYPDNVLSLVLVAAVIRFNDQAKILCETLCRHREADTSDEFKKYAALLYDYGFGEKFKAATPKEKFVADLWPILDKSQHPNGQRRQVDALKNYDASLWIKDIQNIPTLVISPDEDQFSPPEDCKELASALKAKFESIASGHAVLLEQADKISALLQKHL